MKSSHVKTTVVSTSALVLIAIAVRLHSRSSDDSVLRFASKKPNSTQWFAKPLSEKSQTGDPESLKTNPLPPPPSATPQITSHPNTIKLDAARGLQQAPHTLPTSEQIVVTASTNQVELGPEPKEVVELKNVSFDFDALPTVDAEPSAPNPNQNVRQVGYWVPIEDRYDLSTDINLSEPIQEFPAPTELEPELDDPNRLAFWDVENLLQDASSDDSEPSSDEKDSEPSSDEEDAEPWTDEEDAERSADEPERAPPVSDFSGWTTDLLFEQIRNQRATAAEHEIRWSLNDAIMAALIYSNRVSSLKIEPIEELQNVGVQSGTFDIVGFAEQSFRDSAEPVGNTIDTATGVQPIIQEQDLNLVYGLRQQLRTGGEIELNQSFQTRDNDSGILMPRDQVISRFNARLTKELLRGAGRSIAMNEVLVAFHDASAQRAESVSEIANHLNEVMTAYWDIFAARGALFASMENQQLATQVLEELKARRDIDAEPNLLDQAEATIRQRELQVNEANNDLARAQIRLVSLVNAPELLKNLQTIEIMPQVSPDLEARGLDIASRVNTAIQRRPEIADIIQQIKSAQVTNHVSLNDLLPRLSLSLEASLNGLEGDRQTAAAFGNQFENDVTYQVGASVEVPFANRQARYNRRRTELVVERLKADWQMTIEQIKADVLDNAQEFSASQIRLEKQQEILQFSGSELRYLGLRKTVAPKETSNPSFELTQLLAAQDRQGTAKADYIAAVADKHRSIFELNRATGILINADVIPTVGGPPRPGLFSVYHQYIEERSIFADPAITLESQTRAEAKQHRRPGIKQILHSRSHGVDHHAPIEHAPIEHAPIEHTPIQHTPIQHAPIPHAPIQETPRYPLYRHIP